MEDKKQGKRTQHILLAVLLVLIGIAVLFWMQRPADSLALDPNQKEGTLDGMSEEEIRRLLDDKVAQGQFVLNINTHPIFADGRSKGTLRIENSPQNRYLMVVKLYRKGQEDEEGKLYESGAIRPGSKIEEAALDVVLPRGTYPVSAYVEAYDPETKEFVGKAGAALSITIQK